MHPNPKLLAIIVAITVIGASGAYLGLRESVSSNVSSSITGPETPVHLYIEKGYNNTTIPYPPFPENPKNGSQGVVYKKNITAITEINNGSGYLNFTVTIYSAWCDLAGIDEETRVSIGTHAVVHLPSNLKPKAFRFEAIRLNSSNNIHHDFFDSFSTGINVTYANDRESYPYEGLGINDSATGFYVNSTDFSATSEDEWDIFDYGHPYSLRLKATILGLSQNIDAVVDINIGGEGA